MVQGGRFEHPSSGDSAGALLLPPPNVGAGGRIYTFSGKPASFIEPPPFMVGATGFEPVNPFGNGF